MILNKTKNLLNKISNILNIVGDFIYKNRFIISIVILIFCVLFEISGSSLNAWNSLISTGIDSNTYSIWGTARSIRSDEWAVFTPMTFSQCLNGFKYFSEAIRAEKTDVFMIYGLPVINLMQIFRPFQIGFIILGMSKGLSFFWVGRLLALFLITFEFCMIFTKKNKILSLIGGILVTFSPQIQWWFAVNGTAELFIFGELALILLYNYMNSYNLKQRVIQLLCLIICAGGYILILYPAWQIPLFYVFLALAIWIIIENRKKCKIDKKDIISIIIAIIIFGLCMGYIFTKSYDTIKTITSTVYPGSRVSLGGNIGYKYYSYPMNIFLPEKDVDLKVSTSESSVMFGLFPIGIIISIMAMIKNKKVDLPLILLGIIYTFLSVYSILGFPEFLSKLTLMSNSVPERAFIAIGFLDILILLRGITITEKAPKVWVAAIIMIIFGSYIAIGCKIENRVYITKIMALKMCLMIAYLFFFALMYKSNYGKFFFAIGIIFIMFLAGGRVNPIISGVNMVYDSPLMKEIQRVDKQEKGNWLVNDIGFPIPNYILMSGASVINSTNTYPNLERWHKIDKDKKYEDVYNRYAHINVKIRASEEDFLEKFELIQPDTFTVYLLPEELKVLNVKYIASTVLLEQYSTESIVFEQIGNSNGIVIYRVNY